MKLNTYPKILALLALTWMPSIALSYPGESIVRDPVTGDYIITYWNSGMEPPGLETTVFVPSTKITPELRSRFHAADKNTIVYRYSIRNGSQAKQMLELIILDPVESIIGTTSTRGMKRGTAADAKARIAAMTANEAALSTPRGWSGSVAFGVSKEGSVRIGWDPTYNLALEKSGVGIIPGAEAHGFGFSSLALPGIITAELSGDAPVHGWSGEGPDDTSAIYAQIEKVRMNDFVPRPAAVPAIAVPDPFDAATLLDRIRTEMQTWPSKQLLDAAYSAKLDGYLSSAANAFRMNQPKVAREQIEVVRKMLAKEHHHIDHDDEDDADTEEHKRATRFTIDRLAARVLDFDLRYVLKRTEREHEERDGREQKRH